jgi:hypothetical protein
MLKNEELNINISDYIYQYNHANHRTHKCARKLSCYYLQFCGNLYHSRFLTLKTFYKF